MPDIAAMKLSAVRDNGTRLKDFIDIAYMSTRLTLDKMLESYGRKYNHSNTAIALKSLTYFDDINFDENIRLTRGNFDWQRIKTPHNRHDTPSGTLLSYRTIATFRPCRFI